MSRDTNYHNTVIAYLKQLVAKANSSVGATEATAQGILSALTQINTNLTDNTNALLAEIRDSNVAQEALITSSNNLLTDIEATLTTLESQGVISNLELSNINSELDNIEATLNNIETNDSSFYSSLLSVQNNIETLLNSIDADLSIVISRLDTLLTQTDQVESLLSTINTTLTNNSTVNVNALEQLRLLLVDIDANTDSVEAQLTSLINEHDQTQVLLTNLISAVNEVETTLTGSERLIDVVESTTSGVTDPNVQSVSLLFRGNGGSINGVSVSNNFSFSFTPNKGEDTVGSIIYTVPTTGQQRVIISYVR